VVSSASELIAWLSALIVAPSLASLWRAAAFPLFAASLSFTIQESIAFVFATKSSNFALSWLGGTMRSRLPITPFNPATTFGPFVAMSAGVLKLVELKSKEFAFSQTFTMSLV
jgi:hypothetical protein